MESQKVILYMCFVVGFLACNVLAMTKQQLKNSGKLMKKSCMPKNDVTEEQVGEIPNGKFIEERNVMCYVACIYQMMQVIKNNKLNYEAIEKQVDIMFPPEMKAPMRAMTQHCFVEVKKYKDICEASYYATKCMYEYDPENFFFP